MRCWCGHTSAHRWHHGGHGHGCECGEGREGERSRHGGAERGHGPGEYLRDLREQISELRDEVRALRERGTK